MPVVKPPTISPPTVSPKAPVAAPLVFKPQLERRFFSGQKRADDGLDEWGGGEGFVAAAFSHGGKELWSGTANGTVRLWSVLTGAPQVSLETRFKSGPARNGAVTCFAFPREERQVLASGHDDGRLRLWDARGNRMTRVLEGHDAAVKALTFDARGTLFSAGEDGLLLQWNLTGETASQTIAESSLGWRALVASPDAIHLAVGGDSGAVEVWHAAARQQLWSQSEHDFWICALSFSAQGHAVASGGYDRTVRVWATASGECLQVLSGHSGCVTSVAFAPRGALLASGGNDATVKLWDARAGKLLHSLSLESSVNALAFSADGKFLAAATDRDLLLWKML